MRLLMRKALFLDRDGTLNEDKNFVHKVKDLKILPGVVKGLKYAQSKGYTLIIITNQSGIGRKVFSQEDMKRFNQALIKKLEEYEIKIQHLYYCPHKPSHECECRKPSPKFVLDASSRYHIDLNESYFIGDRDSDVLCGRNAGCKTIRIKSSSEYKVEADYLINRFDEIINII
jgi:histidinol-phosphate phosphatase family protein